MCPASAGTAAWSSWRSGVGYDSWDRFPSLQWKGRSGSFVGDGVFSKQWLVADRSSMIMLRSHFLEFRLSLSSTGISSIPSLSGRDAASIHKFLEGSSVDLKVVHSVLIVFPRLSSRLDSSCCILSKRAFCIWSTRSSIECCRASTASFSISILSTLSTGSISK